MTNPNKELWNAARRILCVRLDSLGDVLMTSPAFRALKSLPNRPQLTLLTSPSGALAGRMVPEIDSVWQVEVAWLKHTPTRKNADVEHALIQRIREQKFDACVIFTVLTQSPLPTALLCYLADVPLRLAHSRENPYQLLTDWVPDHETLDHARHEVERQLELVSSIGARTDQTRLAIRISPQVHHRIERLLEQEQLSDRRNWCVLHPGATAESRRYPIEYFACVASKLQQKQWRVVVTGSGHEASLAEVICRQCPNALNMTGRLELEELASLIAHCPLIITGNTGPAHLAAAVGTPVVDLYALTNPQHTPWQVASRVLNFDVPCRNCLKSVCPEGHHRCLRMVSPDQVIEAVIDLFESCSKWAGNTQEKSLCTR